MKQRVKDFSKGTGFVKQEHKFQSTSNEEGRKAATSFLNLEESDNLQDMINYAASIRENGADLKASKVHPIERLYDQVLTENRQNSNSNQSQYHNNTTVHTNERADTVIASILKK